MTPIGVVISFENCEVGENRCERSTRSVTANIVKIESKIYYDDNGRKTGQGFGTAWKASGPGVTGVDFDYSFYRKNGKKTGQGYRHRPLNVWLP